jgi:hypothetical protein
MADQQNLNSLDRFRKHPGRLVLEEHSHCEVPAGCGGVVLRWRNPHAALPVTLYLYTPVEARCWIDDTVPPSSRVELVHGSHALAIALENVDLSTGLLMCVLVHEPKRFENSPRSEVSEPPLKVLTRADGTWKFTLQEPEGDAWKSPAFDDRGWPALVNKPTPQLKWEDSGAYACQRCADHKAVCLGLPERRPGQNKAPWWRKLRGERKAADTSPNPGNVWIRKSFDIPAPR